MRWTPRVTVATVVVRDDRYLLVEERDKQSQEVVLNQPAGHLEANESLAAAARRETLEETGWEVKLEGVLGLALYTAPANGLTYHRTTFLATPVRQVSDDLDPDIITTHWLAYGEIQARSATLRSPLVVTALDWHRSGRLYPLDLLTGP